MTASFLILLLFFPDFISTEWQEPLNLWKGWILWAGSGLLIASLAIFLLKFLLPSSDAGQAQNEVDLHVLC